MRVTDRDRRAFISRIREETAVARKVFDWRSNISATSLQSSPTLVLKTELRGISLGTLLLFALPRPQPQNQSSAKCCPNPRRLRAPSEERCRTQLQHAPTIWSSLMELVPASKPPVVGSTSACDSTWLSKDAPPSGRAQIAHISYLCPFMINKQLSLYYL
jgi:hypothetical protein